MKDNVLDNTPSGGLPFEQRIRRAWNPTAGGEGFLMVDTPGTQYRNQVAASADLSVPAGAATGSKYTAALTLPPSNDFPLRFVLFVQNNSDTAVSVTVQNTLNGTFCDADGAAGLSVQASGGISKVIQGVGFGTGAPQVAVTTTSAATNGGTLHVELRYA